MEVKDNKYLFKRMIVEHIDENSYRIKTIKYNDKKEEIGNEYSEVITYGALESHYKNPTLAIRENIKDFINKTDYLGFTASKGSKGNHLIEGIQEDKRVYFFVPSDFITEKYIREEIIKKENEQSSRKQVNQPSNISSCIISNVSNTDVQVTTNYNDGRVPVQDIIKDVKNLPQQLVLPKIEEIWGEKGQISYAIEKTDVSEPTDGRIFYEIHGINGAVLRVEINAHTFDKESVAFIERKIKENLKTEQIDRGLTA